MTDQVLTEERRNELAVLLNDEQRLNDEYPKVADYLDTGTRLPGTGNADKDGAFDLRLVHYMIGGNVSTENPYWDIVAPAVSERDGRRVVDGGATDGSARLAYAQMLLQASYAYAILSPETIDWVRIFCDGRPLLELGAGRGYWAGLLSKAGITVAAYDSEPPDTVDNISFPQAAGLSDVWHPVVQSKDPTTLVAAHPGHVLLLCWPPGWGNSMAAEALSSFAAAGGQRVIFVGQSRGGMNATDAFFDSLRDGWSLATEDEQFVSWWNLGDAAEGWVRR